MPASSRPIASRCVTVAAVRARSLLDRHAALATCPRPGSSAPDPRPAAAGAPRFPDPSNLAPLTASPAPHSAAGSPTSSPQSPSPESRVGSCGEDTADNSCSAISYQQLSSHELPQLAFSFRLPAPRLQCCRTPPARRKPANACSFRLQAEVRQPRAPSRAERRTPSPGTGTRTPNPEPRIPNPNLCATLPPHVSMSLWISRTWRIRWYSCRST